jgi:hypothetical protein
MIIGKKERQQLLHVACWSGTIIQDTKDNANGLRNNKYEDYVVDLTNKERIRKVFETFDEDGNGAIDVLELRLKC